MATPLNDLNDGMMGLLLTRRSGSAKAMGEPGPSASQLQTMLEAASRAPDHGKLFPWRFIVIVGDARATLGQVLVSATTKLLLAGSALSFESAGVHHLKGLGEDCELFKLT